MSLLMSLPAVFPVQAVLPAAENLAGTAVGMVRPLAGVGAVIAFLMMFQPLMRGLWRAVVLTVAPRMSLEQRREVDVIALQQMARDFEDFQPGLASDLRATIARGC